MRICIKLILLLILFTGCNLKKPVVDTVITTIKDSTYVKERIIRRDTLIVVPADSLQLGVLIADITEKAIVKQQNRLTLSLRRDGNKIIANCHEDELLLQIALLEKEIEIRRELYVDQQTTINNFVKYVPKFIKYLAWLGGGVILFFIIKIVLKFVKPI